MIKRALISVSDKTGLIELATALHQLQIEIISTGGTSKALREAQIPHREVADVTGFPEIMDGRVKTLHPKVHGAILGKRDEHANVARDHQIEWIDLVVVNLYPFAETIKKPNVTRDEAIENIDIGGPSMIRSAAKNMQWVTVVVDPDDYTNIIAALKNNQSIDETTRQALAAKAFDHTSQYDALIHQYLNPQETLTLQFSKLTDLRYGENPHQQASAYRTSESSGILSAKQHQGKPLSYNNIVDADAALACVKEFVDPACVIVKHANPCGVAIGKNATDAFVRALESDPVSAFGGIVALNQPCDEQAAKKILEIFFEVLIAPSFTKEALTLFQSKPNLRILELPLSKNQNAQDYKFIEGGLLIQDKDLVSLEENELKCVTEAKPRDEDKADILFAWRVVKHIKSNAIILAKNHQMIGMGGGQVSRIDAVETAIKKAGDRIQQAVLASDAFFPFRDSIDRLAGLNIRAIVQPGGSMRDEEVIAACNEQGIAMVFTGKRCFKH